MPSLTNVGWFNILCQWSTSTAWWSERTERYTDHDRRCSGLHRLQCASQRRPDHFELPISELSDGRILRSGAKRRLRTHLVVRQLSRLLRLSAPLPPAVQSAVRVQCRCVQRWWSEWSAPQSLRAWKRQVWAAAAAQQTDNRWQFTHWRRSVRDTGRHLSTLSRFLIKQQQYPYRHVTNRKRVWIWTN